MHTLVVMMSMFLILGIFQSVMGNLPNRDKEDLSACGILYIIIGTVLLFAIIFEIVF